MVPVIYQELKDISPARSKGEVPCVAESVLRKIECLSALSKNDDFVLPSDVVQAVFRAVYLSGEEKKQFYPICPKQLQQPLQSFAFISKTDLGNMS